MLGYKVDDDPPGSWDIPREPSDAKLLPEMAVAGGRNLSIRERIRMAGEIRYKKKPQVVEAHPKGLRRHIHYSLYERMRWTNRLNLFLALGSLVMGVWQCELHWQTEDIVPPDNPTQGPIGVPTNTDAFREFIKLGAGIGSCLTVIGVFYYYNTMLTVEKARGTMLPTDNFYSAGYLPFWLMETLVCILQPIPFWSFRFTKSEVFGIVVYESDQVLTACMFLRVYLVFRVFRDFYGLNKEDNRHIGTFTAVNLEDFLVTCKNLVLDCPITVVPAIYTMCIVSISYCVCIFERPIDVEFSYIQNGIWVVLVTMSTIGYGDLYPTTDVGRFLIVVCCAFAILSLVLMVIGFRSFFKPTAREMQVFNRLTYNKWLEKAKWYGAIVIQSFWRSCLNVTRTQRDPGAFGMRQFPTYLRDTSLSHKIREFHNVRL